MTGFGLIDRTKHFELKNGEVCSGARRAPPDCGETGRAWETLRGNCQSQLSKVHDHISYTWSLTLFRFISSCFSFEYFFRNHAICFVNAKRCICAEAGKILPIFSLSFLLVSQGNPKILFGPLPFWEGENLLDYIQSNKNPWDRQDQNFLGLPPERVLKSYLVLS